MTCFAAQRNPDQLRCHRFERGCFGIDSGQVGSIDACDPGVKLGFG
jgi:hypothetical protein